MNKVQILFNELIEEYNLRAITIGDETWYGINDLPMGADAVRKAIQRLEKSNNEYVQNNVKFITNLDTTSSPVRNFDK